MTIIKDALKGSPLYFYHLNHPENDFIHTLMNKSFIIDRKIFSVDYANCRMDEDYYARYICYRDIIKSDQLNIIHDIVRHVNNDELEILGIVAINENNKDIIKFLYENGLNFVFEYDGTNILVHAYRKHGLELLKFIGDLEIQFIIVEFNCAVTENDRDLLDYLVDNNKPLDNMFLTSLRRRDDIRATLNLFADKVDLTKYEDEILRRRYKSIDTVKLLPEYGISLDFNKLLKSAHISDDLEVVEFCLQNGAGVDKEFLRDIIRHTIMLSLSLSSVNTGAAYRKLLSLFMEYDVDFSIFEADEPNHEFLAELENHGLDKDKILSKILML